MLSEYFEQPETLETQGRARVEPAHAIAACEPGQGRVPCRPRVDGTKGDEPSRADSPTRDANQPA